MTILRKIDRSEALPYLLGTHYGTRFDEFLQNDAREAWRVKSVETDGYLVTECFDDLLFVWNYAGRGYFPLSRELARIALDNGLSRLGWMTRHKAPLWIYRDVRGTIRNDGGLATEYIFYCEDLCVAENKLLEV